MRVIHKKQHLIAISLALIFFIIGILLGNLIDNERVDKVTEINNIHKLDYESLQLQYIYLESVLADFENCDAAEQALNENINDLVVITNKIDGYIESQNLISNSEEFKLLKREYTLTQLRYWLLAKKINDKCSTDSVSLLYFYSNDNCDSCEKQGFVLSSLKKELNEKLLNFVIDLDLAEDEAMIRILQNSYGISSVPSLVINDKVYGEMNKEDILEKVCPLYEEKPLIC